jgi:hypothetical protein
VPGLREETRDFGKSSGSGLEFPANPLHSIQSVQTVAFDRFAKKPLERGCFGGMFESQTHGAR